MEPHVPANRTVKLRYAHADDHSTYCLNDRSPRYGGSVSHYVPKIVKTLLFQKKTHGLEPNDLIPTPGVLATSKLACDANCMHEDTKVLAMPHFVADRVASLLESCMVQIDRTKGTTTTVSSWSHT